MRSLLCSRLLLFATIVRSSLNIPVNFSCGLLTTREECLDAGCSFDDECFECSDFSEAGQELCESTTGCIWDTNLGCIACASLKDGNWHTCGSHKCSLPVNSNQCSKCDFDSFSISSCLRNGCGFDDNNCVQCNYNASDEKSCELESQNGCVWDSTNGCLPLSLSCDHYTSKRTCLLSINECSWSNNKCIDCTKSPAIDGCDFSNCLYFQGTTCSSSKGITPESDGIKCYLNSLGYDEVLDVCVDCSNFDADECHYRGCVINDHKCQSRLVCTDMKSQNTCKLLETNCGWNGYECVECASIAVDPLNKSVCAMHGCGYTEGESCSTCASIFTTDSLKCQASLCTFSKKESQCSTCHFHTESNCTDPECEFTTSCLNRGELCSALIDMSSCEQNASCIWEETDFCKSKFLSCDYYTTPSSCKLGAHGCGWVDNKCKFCVDIENEWICGKTHSCSWCDSLRKCQNPIDVCQDCSYFSENQKPSGCIEEVSVKSKNIVVVVCATICTSVFVVIVGIFIYRKKANAKLLLPNQLNHTSSSSSSDNNFAIETVIDIPSKQELEKINSIYSKSASESSISSVSVSSDQSGSTTLSRFPPSFTEQRKQKNNRTK